MKINSGCSKVLWSELLPFQFKQRLAECPTVYLPLGLCEPHGQVSAFGLDTIKAEWLCEQAAQRSGGIVAPSLGYHIHETGPHAPWLEETVGENNPHMTALPPDVFLRLFLYQLRAFVNAGFRAIMVVTGHSGGNQVDIRRAAQLFMERVPVTVWVCSDPELVEGQFQGDHAGKYELSQLMYIRPDLVDMEAIAYEAQEGSGGRLALGEDAAEANAEFGEQIMNACLAQLCVEAERCQSMLKPEAAEMISYETVELVWRDLLLSVEQWTTSNPSPSQQAVTAGSRWKPYERFAPS